MNKKSVILMYPVIFGFILAISIFYITLIKEAPETFYIGEIQIATLKAMYETEKDLVYIDNAAIVAGQKTIYDLAKNGGFEDKSECGEYGFQLWNNKDMNCFPEYENNFKSLFNEKLNEFLKKISFSLMDNYDFLIEQNNKLNIKGSTKKKLEKRYVIERGIIRGSALIKITVNPTTVKNLYEQKKIKDPELIEFVKDEAKRQNVDLYIVLGLITMESGWNENALRCEDLYESNWEERVDELKGCKDYDCDKTIDSPQGPDYHQVSCSYGLTQLIYPTAWGIGFREKGTELFDGKKSVEYGIKHLKGLFDDYDDVRDVLVGYNAGRWNIGNAKRKCKNDDFEIYYACLTHPHITGPYVKRILAYSEIYRDIEENQELKTGGEYITGYAVKEEKEEKPTITYSVNPSFKVNLDYNIDIYQNIIDDAENLIKECTDKGGNELLECVDDYKNRLTQDCETEEENDLEESKRTFKFCYKTNKKVLTEEGMKESIIKFALMFPDTKPPEALQLETLNYPNDKYKIILTWENSTAMDIDSYNIYYSDEPFNDMTTKELNENEEIIKIELSLEAEEIEINLNECGFPEEAPCKFAEEEKDNYEDEDYKIELESDKLYLTENKYFYVLDLENKNYNFLVTAVDDSDNEIGIEDKNFKTIKAKNRLPFKEVRNLKVEQDGTNIRLTWYAPEKYKDGTEFEDEELKTYRIRLIDRASADSQKIPSDEAMEREEYIKDREHTFNNILRDDYYYSVFAVNNDDVEGEYASYP